MSKVKELAKILGTTTTYLLGESEDSSAEVKTVIVDEKKTEKPHKELPGLAYWGGVVDNMRELLKYGTKEEISDARNMLKRALSLETGLADSGIPSVSGVSAYNGSNSNYSAAVMSVNTAVESVKGA